MPRARLLKPGFFTDEDIAELPPLARLLFQGLWTVADREGRLEDRPKRLKVELLPYDDCDADDLLAEIAGKGFIVRYEVEGRRFIQVRTFSKHQHPHVREPASSIPAPTEPGASTSPAPVQHDPGPAESESESVRDPGSAEGAPPPSPQPPDDGMAWKVKRVFEGWNEIVGEPTGAAVRDRSDKRVRKVRARLEEIPEGDVWAELFEKAAALRSAGCTWLTFDWLFRNSENPEKLQAGAYDFRLPKRAFDDGDGMVKLTPEDLEQMRQEATILPARGSIR